MPERLISGDNHIDLTYCSPDFRSAQTPARWKLLAPRVEELEDGLHWGADYPHPDCIWPESRGTIEKKLGMLSKGVRRKITSENVTKLYNPR